MLHTTLGKRPGHMTPPEMTGSSIAHRNEPKPASSLDPEHVDISEIKPRWEVAELARLACTKSRLVIPICDELISGLNIKHNELLGKEDIASTTEKTRILRALEFGRMIHHLLAGDSSTGSFSEEADRILRRAVAIINTPDGHPLRDVVDHAAQELYVNTPVTDPIACRAALDALLFVRQLNRVDPVAASDEKDLERILTSDPAMV